jgi:hypothetical protein
VRLMLVGMLREAGPKRFASSAGRRVTSSRATLRLLLPSEESQAAERPTSPLTDAKPIRSEPSNSEADRFDRRLDRDAVTGTCPTLGEDARRSDRGRAR